MGERGFSIEDVLHVLNGNALTTLIFESPEEKDVDIYMGYAGKKHMMIPVNRKTKTLITIRPMRREERKVFEMRTTR